jgi:GNAT superfamily N-acetyltransferase
MKILRHRDRDINFLGYAQWLAGEPDAQVVRGIRTSRPGVRLTVARRKGDSVVLIEKSGVAVAAVLLEQIRNRKLAALGYVAVPHAYTLPEHRGQRLVEGVYRWALDNGVVLCSHWHQTRASNGLWRKLSADYECSFFHRRRCGPMREDELIDDVDCRLMLRRGLRSGHGVFRARPL